MLDGVGFSGEIPCLAPEKMMAWKSAFSFGVRCLFAKDRLAENDVTPSELDRWKAEVVSKKHRPRDQLT